MKTCCLMAMMAAGACWGATVTLPVGEVKQVADEQAKSFPGRVEAMQRVEITPEVSGDILEVCFANGDIVKQGTVLYKLLDVKYKSAMRNAQAKVAECQAKKLNAESNLKRYESVKENAVTKVALDSAKSDVAVTTAALAAAEADLAVAEYNLKRCQIITPIDGKTGSTRLTRGNPASPSTPLVSVVQIQPIRVRFSVSNSDYLTMFGGKGRTLQEKGVVAITLANGSTYNEAGKIEYVENLADEQTDTMRVYATFPNAERILKPGGTVGVTLRNKDGVAKCAVPPSAVMQDAQGAYVWVVGADGTAARRAIVRGRLTTDLLFIEEGLKPGERVVTDGTHKVAAGDKVEAAK